MLPLCVGDTGMPGMVPGTYDISRRLIPAHLDIRALRAWPPQRIRKFLPVHVCTCARIISIFL